MSTDCGKVEVTRVGLLGIANEVIELIARKNHDYGDAWQAQGINGVLVRLADKLYRIDNLADREALVASETVEDTLKDAIGYALLGLLYLRCKRNAAPFRLVPGTGFVEDRAEPEDGVEMVVPVNPGLTDVVRNFRYSRATHRWEAVYKPVGK